MLLSTFRGGIHPPGYKHITEDKQFVSLRPPRICAIPLQQHIGAPAKPVVQPGDQVVVGQLLGEADGHISANIHSSVDGKVLEIKNTLTVYHRQPTVFIETGPETIGRQAATSKDWQDLDRDQILACIKDGGIVGLGGAAFPTVVKLAASIDKKINVLIVNGAECEPYLTTDSMLMQTYPADIVMGTLISMKILGVNKAIIGIENNKIAAIHAIRKAIHQTAHGAHILVKELKTKYPQGSEKQLIYSITKRKVHSRGLPVDVGVIVQNVGTLFAIYEMVAKGKPLYERFITVSGEAVANPGNYRVRIGTTIGDIVDQCGGFKEEPAKVIMGGPMCGVSVHVLDIPVVKGTSGVLFLTRDEIRIRPYSACIRCGKCVAICPVGLMPCDIGTAVEMEKLNIASTLNPHDCIMCGSCSYVCPAHRPLSHFIKLAQQRIKKIS